MVNDGDLTIALKNLAAGDPMAMEQFVSMVYRDLRRMAMYRLSLERNGHTLQPTALVHEVILKLFSGKDSGAINDSRHFFRLAARVMRQILVDSARAHVASVHRNQIAASLGAKHVMGVSEQELLLDVDDWLNELETVDTGAADIVKLRLYAGLSVTEAAHVLGVSRSTAYDHWLYARAWFSERMSPETNPC